MKVKVNIVQHLKTIPAYIQCASTIPEARNNLIKAFKEPSQYAKVVHQPMSLIKAKVC